MPKSKEYGAGGGYGAGYGKRPLWQWVLLYLVIGGIVYAAVYYIFFANKGGYSYSASPSTNTQQTPTYTY